MDRAMSCTTLLTRIEMFLEGRLLAAEQKAASAHLAGCPRCREIVKVMRTDLRFMSDEPPAGLTESILERTSGRPCDRARELLGDLVDGAVTGLDRDLIEGHLESCADCAAVRRALTQLAGDLPVFATLRPIPSLVDDVMALTVERRSPWRDVLSATWQSLLGRSRLALEAGYVGAVLLWLVFGASWAPLRAAPAQALAVVQRNHVGSAVETVTSRLTNDTGEAWDRFWSSVSRTHAREPQE
jgi:predicted anti-sigma-YlaC factor YlaD